MKPGFRLPLEIVVPFAYQTKLSGLGPTDEIHPVIWYRRSFTVPGEMQRKRVLLRFGAVDYECSVYINGQMAGTHKGGYTPFALDITPLLTDGENDLCLRVEDQPDCTQPRGKQYWNRGLMGCWYTPVSGIWQAMVSPTRSSAEEMVRSRSLAAMISEPSPAVPPKTRRVVVPWLMKVAAAVLLNKYTSRSPVETAR